MSALKKRKRLPTISPATSALVTAYASNEPEIGRPERSFLSWKWLAMSLCFVSLICVVQLQPRHPETITAFRGAALPSQASLQTVKLDREFKLDSVATLDPVPIQALPQLEVEPTETSQPIVMPVTTPAINRVSFRPERSRFDLQRKAALSPATRPEISEFGLPQPDITSFEDDKDSQLNFPYETQLLGTKIPWAPSIQDAISYGTESEKLVFVILVSGNFAREEFT